MECTNGKKTFRSLPTNAIAVRRIPAEGCRFALRRAIGTLSLALLVGLMPGVASGVDGEVSKGPRQSIVVGFLTGHGEVAPDGGLSEAAGALHDEFKIREIDLSAGRSSLDGVTTVVVAGAPDIRDVELYELDQFLMRGGRIAFFLDAANIPETGYQADIAEGNIFGFLSVYGVTINPDLVLDFESAPRASWHDVRTNLPYAYWPLVKKENINSDVPPLTDVAEVPFAWTSSISVSNERPGDTNVTELLRSSGYSWTVPAYSDLDPARELSPLGRDAMVIIDGNGPGHTLAVALEGVFESAFRGKKLIVEEDGRPRFTDPVDMVEQSRPTRIVVFGSSLLFSDELADQFPGNIEVFRSVISWLTTSNAPVEPTGEVDTDGHRRGARSLRVLLAVAGVFALIWATVMLAGRMRKRM